MNKIQKRIKANKIIGFLAFRDHYSSIPGRHSWILCGKPVYWWKMREAIKSKYLEKIVLWTEVKEAQETAAKMSNKFVILKRTLEECKEPPYKTIDNLKTPLSRKDISTRILGESFLGDKVEKALGFKNAIYIQLMANRPLEASQTIDRVIEKYFEDDEAEEARCVSRISPYLYFNNPKSPQYILPLWASQTVNKRQDMVDMFIAGGVVIRTYGWTGMKRIVYIEVPWQEEIEIHDRDDLELAEFYLQKRLNE